MSGQRGPLAGIRVIDDACAPAGAGAQRWAEGHGAADLPCREIESEANDRQGRHVAL